MPSKFDFISPDILLREVDESQVAPETTEDGALIIGQALRGPAMQPVRIKNLDDLYTIYGRPQSGNNDKDDVWRSGNTKLPTYGLYAAQAWLSTQTSPVTFVRLAGEDSTNQGGSYTLAGWNTGEAINSAVVSNKTAYGLFIMPSGAAGATLSGTLGAIIYADQAAVALSGTLAGSTTKVRQAGALIACDSTAGAMAAITIEISRSAGLVKIPIHFDKNKKNGFIRNALNTNPQLLNTINQVNSERYFLGETFETSVYETLETAGSASAGKQYAILLPLASGSTSDNNLANHNRQATVSKTGWFIGRDPSPTQETASFNSSDMKKLFRLNSLHHGEAFQRSYAVKISDLLLGTDKNPNSTFTVSIVDIKGDAVEQFSGCNLNEDSDDFVGKKIGDIYQDWNSTQEKYIVKGNYPNNSNYVYVEMADDWKAGIDDKYTLPFGFYGPSKFKSFSINSGSTSLLAGATTAYVVRGGDGDLALGHNEGTKIANLAANLTCSLSFPELELTTTGSKKGADYKYSDVFGVRHFRSDDQAESRVWKQADYIDLVRPLANGHDIHAVQTQTETSFIFSLDEIVWDVSSDRYYYKAGSHASGNALTAKSGSAYLIGTKKVKQFQAPFFGGTDGVDITLVDPFSSKSGQALTNSTTATSHYAHYSVQKVLDIAADKEVVQYDVISMPGLLQSDLRRELVNNTEERGDALAIIDFDSGHKAEHENTGVYANGTAAEAITDANTQDYNTSYATAYYPPVVLGGEDMGLRVPASVAGLGVLAQSDAASGAPWFAPAGFNRGGIRQLGGNQGPRVQRPVENLNKADRDDLYQANINPIANFPGEGPVVFGQKTLQQTPSALDRINVRRLMIHLKKKIGVVARNILFDNNVRATWNRFKAGANPILSDAKTRFGISEYKLVLDETTTTPDYQDRNIMYAKVFIKPAKAIEFIAIDFNITRSGIEF